MAIDTKKLDYSIKGRYLVKPLVRYFYAPLTRPLLYTIAFLRLPVAFVNLFSLILTIIAAVVIFLYPDFIWLAGLLVLFSIIAEIAASSWVRYNKQACQYYQWVDETTWMVRVFVIFLAGAFATYNVTQNPFIFVLFGISIFSIMMMHYAGALISLMQQKDERKEDLREILKNTIIKRNWVTRSPIGFSFEYQWTVIILLVALNQFVLLFWIFIIFGNLKWLQGYLSLWNHK